MQVNLLSQGDLLPTCNPIQTTKTNPRSGLIRGRGLDYLRKVSWKEKWV